MAASTEGKVLMDSRLRTASWVLLAIVGGLTLLFSLVSSYWAYWGSYPIGGVPVAQVAGGRDGLLTALRGIRGTSAAFGAAFAVMLLGTVLGPYRRGDTRAWWTILLATLALALIVLARVPTLGVALGQGGTAMAFTLGGLVVIALLLDVGRLSRADGAVSGR
jgi:hypothetical protein